MLSLTLSSVLITFGSERWHNVEKLLKYQLSAHQTRETKIRGYDVNGELDKIPSEM